MPTIANKKISFEVKFVQFSLCISGYYCPGKADKADFIECPAGSYCIAGSPTPTACPAGTFSNVTGLTAEAQCTNCSGGYYCPDPGKIFH
jgi:hypothetical protein